MPRIGIGAKKAATSYIALVQREREGARRTRASSNSPFDSRAANRTTNLACGYGSAGGSRRTRPDGRLSGSVVLGHQSSSLTSVVLGQPRDVVRVEHVTVARGFRPSAASIACCSSYSWSRDAWSDWSPTASSGVHAGGGVLPRSSGCLSSVVDPLQGLRRRYLAVIGRRRAAPDRSGDDAPALEPDDPVSGPDDPVVVGSPPAPRHRAPWPGAARAGRARVVVVLVTGRLVHHDHPGPGPTGPARSRCAAARRARWHRSCAGRGPPARAGRGPPASPSRPRTQQGRKVFSATVEPGGQAQPLRQRGDVLPVRLAGERGPSTCTDPLVAGSTPASTWHSADLPDPDRPTSATTSPAYRSRSTSCSATTRWEPWP